MTTKKKFDFIVYVGRFMPAHNAHIKTIRKALRLAKNVIVLLGSANQSRTVKNPWSWEEREKMISSCFTKGEQTRIRFAPIEDSVYNDQQWIVDVQSAVDGIIATANQSIGLIGFDKDTSSSYLKMFPQWEFVPMELVHTPEDLLHSTNVRGAYFEYGVTPGERYAPLQIQQYLSDWMKTPEYIRLKKEYEHIQQYKSAWSASPYAPVFVTVDAVVITAGHVLAVKRKAALGAGLWALPGGFLDPNERLLDGMLRELREETKLKVPEPVLRGSIVSSNVFDAPERSLRGRTITKAYLINLEATGRGLPKVKGGSDASKAKWIPLNEAYATADMWFEDHIQIVKHFVGEV